MRLFFGLLFAVIVNNHAAAEETLIAAEPVSQQKTVLESALHNTSIHGYITTDFNGGKLIDDSSEKNKITPNFEQVRFVFGFQSQLAENWLFNSEVEFEHATRVGVKTTPQCSTCTTSVITSASAGLEIEIEQAWLENQTWDFFKPRVGVILVPLGRLNINHDADTVATVERPLSDQVIIPTTWYEPGVGFTGHVDFGIGLSYEAYVINGLRASAKNAGDESKLRDLRMSKDASNDGNTDKAIVGRLAVQPINGIELAFSGYRGAYDPAGTLFFNYGAIDGKVSWMMLELEGEWVQLATDLPNQEQVNAGMITSSDAGYFKKTDAEMTPFASVRGGWYLQLLGNLGLGSWGKLQPFVNISQVDPNVERATSADKTRVTVGLNYRPVESVVFKLNYADTQSVKGYTVSGPDKSQAAIIDQRVQAAAAWAF